jgi:hypothetical protein
MGKSKHDSKKKSSSKDSKDKCTVCPSVNVPSCPSISSVSIPTLDISVSTPKPSVSIPSIPTKDSSMSIPSVSNCFSCGSTTACSCSTKTKSKSKTSKKSTTTESCESSSSDEELKIRSGKCKFEYPSCVVRRGKRGPSGDSGKGNGCCPQQAVERRLRVPGFWVQYDVTAASGLIVRSLSTENIVPTTLYIQEDGSEVTVSVYPDDAGIPNPATNELVIESPFVFVFQTTLTDFDFFSLNLDGGFKLPVRDHMSSAYAERNTAITGPDNWVLRDLRLTITRIRGHLILSLATGAVPTLDSGIISAPLNSAAPLLTYTESGAEVDPAISAIAPMTLAFNRSYTATYVARFLEFFTCPIVGTDPAAALQALVTKLRNYLLVTGLNTLGNDIAFIQAQVDAFVAALNLITTAPQLTATQYHNIVNAGSLDEQYAALRAYLITKGFPAGSAADLDAAFGLASFQQVLTQLFSLTHAEFMCFANVAGSVPTATFKSVIAALTYTPV